MRLSTKASPAQPAVKPTPRIRASPIVSPRLPPPSSRPSTDSSTISTPCTRISPKRKASTPTENIARATRDRAETRWNRPKGSPR
jgi:hypothetical protein